jgi:hypothetical protein
LPPPRICRAPAELHARVASTGWWGSGADQADLIYGAWLHHGQAADRDAARGLWRQLLRYGGKTEAEIARITAETEAAAQGDAQSDAAGGPAAGPRANPEVTG